MKAKDTEEREGDYVMMQCPHGHTWQSWIPAAWGEHCPTCFSFYSRVVPGQPYEPRYDEEDP